MTVLVIIIFSQRIKKYSRPIGFLYFYRPINIMLSTEAITLKTHLADYLKKSHNLKIGRLPLSRATIGRRSADTSANEKGLIQIINYRRPTIGRSSADCQNPKLSADGKKNNKVVITFFLSADEKRAKIRHFKGR